MLICIIIAVILLSNLYCNTSCFGRLKDVYRTSKKYHRVDASITKRQNKRQIANTYLSKRALFKRGKKGLKGMREREGERKCNYRAINSSLQKKNKTKQNKPSAACDQIWTHNRVAKQRNPIEWCTELDYETIEFRTQLDERHMDVDTWTLSRGEGRNICISVFTVFIGLSRMNRTIFF